MKLTREEAEAIAMTYCTNKFPYDYPDNAEGRDQKARHLAYDTKCTADQIMQGDCYPWLVAVYELGKQAGYDEGYGKGRDDEALGPLA